MDVSADARGDEFCAENGELVALVGPGGAGHVALGRLVAGLERSLSGEIFVGSAKLSPTGEPSVAFVGHGSALFGHLSVRRNLVFPLQQAKLGKAEIAKRVEQTAKLLRLEPFLDADPEELTDVQRVRAVLGRAVALRPQVYVFEETLKSLAPADRLELEVVLASLRQQLQAAMLWITHDATEALRLADKVLVFNGGSVQQIGTPDVVYGKPANLFVAGFFGTPATNLIPGKLKQVPGGLLFKESGEGGMEIKLPVLDLPETEIAKEIVLGIRPEHICPSEGKAGLAKFQAILEFAEFTGVDSNLYLQAGAHAVQCRTKAQISHEDEGRRLGFEFDPNQIQLFDAVTSKRILCKPI